jgi:basic amino acid/polyamine antiporter, APA family
MKPGDKFAHPIKPESRPLRRILRTPHLFGIAYGNIGSSIYYALGLIALAAGGATPVALGLAGILFVFTALSYAEGTAMYPESGGAASFARHGFSDFVGFTAGWALMFGYIVAIAISAFAIPSYLGFFWPPLKLSPVIMTSFAMGIVAFLALVNIIGVRESSMLNIAMTILDIVTQIVLILLAVFFFFNPQLIWERITNYWPAPQDLLFSVAIAAIAFTGLETISQMAAETKRPTVRAPKALILVVVVVLVIFAGISFSAFSTMTPGELANNWMTDPIAGIAHKISVGLSSQDLANKYFSLDSHKQVLIWFIDAVKTCLPVLIAMLAAVILLIATNAGLLGISRLAFSMSRVKLLPEIMGRVHAKSKTPYFSIILFACIAIVLQTPGFFVMNIYSHLGGLYAFGSMLSFALAHASIIVLRIKEPDRARPFKLRWNIRVKGKDLPVTALLGLIGTFAIWLVVIIMQDYTRWVGFAWLLVGVFVYWYTKIRTKNVALNDTGTTESVEL